MLDSVNIDGMVTRKATDDDSGDAALVLIEQHQPAHRSSCVKWTESCGKQILHANCIGVRFARSLKCWITHALRCRQSLSAPSILQVSDLVRDDKSKFSDVILQYLYQLRSDENNVVLGIGLRVQPNLICDNNVKHGHGVRVESSICRAAQEFCRYIVDETLKRSRLLRDGAKRRSENRQNQYMAHEILSVWLRVGLARLWSAITLLRRSIQPECDHQDCDEQKPVASALASATRRIIVPIGNRNATAWHSAGNFITRLTLGQMALSCYGVA